MKGLILALAALASSASAEVQNLTGLPLYPNLNTAVMDPRMRTDTLGHWCSRLSAETSDSIVKVEAWYRKTWTGSSETDLTHDKDYKEILTLTGVRLAWGIDSVSVFQVSRGAPTTIRLSRCSH